MAEAGLTHRLSGPRACALNHCTTSPLGKRASSTWLSRCKALSIGGGCLPPSHFLLDYPRAKEARFHLGVKVAISLVRTGQAPWHHRMEGGEGIKSIQMGKLRPREETTALESWERGVQTLPSVPAPLTCPAASLLFCLPSPTPSTARPRIEPGTWQRLLDEFNWRIHETPRLAVAKTHPAPGASP